jgi:hypothetical protein
VPGPAGAADGHIASPLNQHKAMQQATPLTPGPAGAADDAPAASLAAGLQRAPQLKACPARSGGAQAIQGRAAAVPVGCLHPHGVASAVYSTSTTQSETAIYKEDSLAGYVRCVCVQPNHAAAQEHTRHEASVRQATVK